MQPPPLTRVPRRAQQDKYIAVARLRVRELELNGRASKRELRHARKTVKTFEAMALMGTLGGGGAQQAQQQAAPPPPPPAPAAPAVDPAQVANAVVRAWGARARACAGGRWAAGRSCAAGLRVSCEGGGGGG